MSEEKKVKKVKEIKVKKDYEKVEFIKPVKVGFCYYKIGDIASFHKNRCEQIIDQKFGKKA